MLTRKLKICNPSLAGEAIDEEAKSYRYAAGKAYSDFGSENDNEKDAMLIVIQNLISENQELKRRLNLHENKCSIQAPVVREYHKVDTEDLEQ